MVKCIESVARISWKWGHDSQGGPAVTGIMFPNKEAWLLQKMLIMSRPETRSYPLATARQTIIDRQRTPSCGRHPRH